MRRARRRRRSGRPATARARYSIPAGGKASVKVKLNRAGKKKLKGKQSLRVRVKLMPKGGSAVTTRLKLKR